MAVGTATPSRRTQVLSVLLIVLAVGQFVASIFPAVFGADFTTSDRPDEPLIVPPGYAFSIWFVIEVLSLAYAVWAWSQLRRHDRPVLRRLQVPLAITFAGFSVWLAVTEIEPIWSNLVVLIIMVVALVVGMRTAVAGRDELSRDTTSFRLLVWGLLGLYLGWTSMAMWLNLTTAVVSSGAPVDGVVGHLGQAAVLAGATITAVMISRLSGGLPAYVAAVAWAFVGIVLGAAYADAAVLSVIAVIGLVIIVAVTVLTRRSHLRRASTGLA